MPIRKNTPGASAGSDEGEGEGSEYSVVVGPNAIEGIGVELNKRAAEGWELVGAYQQTSGWFWFPVRRHILIFRRAL